MAARKPRPRRVFTNYTWTQVMHRLHCALGEHGVTAGVWVRYRRGDHLRMASCEECLKRQYGIERPARPFVFRSDAKMDARRRRAEGTD